jgi:RHS repeat-associated protein
MKIRYELIEVWRERVRFVRRVLVTSIALSAGVQVAAQIPAVPSIVDGNGVNLATGIFSVSSPAVVVGAPAEGLAFYKTFSGSTVSYSLLGGITTSDSLQSISVAVGSRSTVYSRAPEDGSKYYDISSGLRAVQRNPADGSFVETRPDGTVLRFSAAYGTAMGGYLAPLTSITYRSGEKITIEYEQSTYCFQESCTPCILWGLECTYLYSHYDVPGSRPARITSTRGYEIRLNYFQPNDHIPNAWEFFDLVSVEGLNLIDPSSSSMPSISVAYDGTLFTDATGREFQVVKDSNGVIAVREPGLGSPNVVVSYGNGRVSTVTRDGVATQYAYSGGTTTVTAPGAGQQSYSFEGGKLASSTNALNVTTYYFPDRIDFSTGVTVSSYAGVTSIETVVGGAVSSFTINSVSGAGCVLGQCAKPDWTRDSRGNQTDYTYDPVHGAILTVTSPSPDGVAPRPQTRYGYTSVEAWYKNAAGVMAASGYPIYMLTSISTCRTTASCAGTADELRTVLDYGTPEAGRNLHLASVTTQSGNGSDSTTVRYSYDLAGNTTRVDGPLAGNADSLHMRYDVLRRTVGVIAPDPDGAGHQQSPAQRFNYDSHGRPWLVESGITNESSDAGWAAFVPHVLKSVDYDAAQHPVKTSVIVDGVALSLVQQSYDSFGRPECSVLRMNPAVFSSLPGSACVAGPSGQFGPDRISRNFYTSQGLLERVTTAVGVVGVERTLQAYTYWPDGKLLTVADGNHNTTTYEYDEFNRLKKLRYPSETTPGSSSQTDFEESFYAGAVLDHVRARGGTETRLFYDNLGRVSVQDASGVALDVYLSYDNHGRVLSARQGNALAPGTVHEYDGLGRLAMTTTFGRSVSYQYDAAGNRRRVTHPDGFYADYIYNVGGQLQTISDSTGTELIRMDYDLYGRRQRINRGSSAAPTHYGWSAGSRLSSLIHDLAGSASDRTASYTYTPSGQLSQRTLDNDVAYSWRGHSNQLASMAHDGLNQTGHAHDASGNLTGGDAVWSFAYDAQNKLTAATSASVTVNLSYGPNGLLRRLERSSTDATEFLFDGSDLIAEYDNAGSVVRRYVHGVGVDEPLVWYEGQGTADRRWLHSDERGSVVAVSNDSGQALQTYSYSPYGEVSVLGGSRFRYTGQPFLSEIGLHYYKTRMYSGPLGRFLQPDSIGYAGGMNLYGYVGGDPVNRVDPWGMQAAPANGEGPVDCSSNEGQTLPQCLLPQIDVNGIRCLIVPELCPRAYLHPWELGGGGQGNGNIGGGGLPPGDGVPQTQKPHNYKVDIPLGVCVSPREGFDVMRNFSAPGIFHAQDGTHEIELAGGNWIQQTVDPAAMTISNVAIPGRHVFGGYVNISMTQRNGVTVAHIEGGGSGPNARANQFWGPKIFEALGAAAFTSISCNGVGAAL